MVTPNSKEMFGDAYIGKGIRGTIGKNTTYRVRRGNGHYASILGEVYQDKYAYSAAMAAINNATPFWQAKYAAGVAYWKNTLTAEQKTEYNRRASKGLKMSGYNLFLREAITGVFPI